LPTAAPNEDFVKLKNSSDRLFEHFEPRFVVEIRARNPRFYFVHKLRHFVRHIATPPILTNLPFRDFPNIVNHSLLERLDRIADTRQCSVFQKSSFWGATNCSRRMPLIPFFSRISISNISKWLQKTNTRFFVAKTGPIGRIRQPSAGRGARLNVC
jgi:hypothetical protein